MNLDLFSRYTRTCLDIFTHSIDECNRYGSDKWGVTIVNPRHYRLIMGSLVVATIESGTVWLAVDIQNDNEHATLDKLINWGWTPQFKYVNPPSKCGYYWPMEDHEKTWPVIQRLHDRYLAKVAETYDHLRTTSQGSHSEEALVGIEQALGIILPRPSYS